jgi:tRNA1(Val) A37 N6-methylase TrmN6
MSCAPRLETTRDALLGGRVRLDQPAKGFRIAIDTVLLAAAVPAKPGERIADLGAGVGGAALCLAARQAGADVTGYEIDPALVAVANANAVLNRVGDRVRFLAADVGTFRAPRRRFDHVMTNPPFHDAGRATGSPDTRKARANMIERDAFLAWMKMAAKLARPGGTVTIIDKTARLGELLAALDGPLGALRVLPVMPRLGAPATRTIVRGIVGRRTPLAVLHPLVLHERDGRYRPEAEAILREGEPLAL